MLVLQLRLIFEIFNCSEKVHPPLDPTSTYENYPRNIGVQEDDTSDYQQLDISRRSHESGETVTTTQLNINDTSSAYEVVGTVSRK